MRLLPGTARNSGRARAASLASGIGIDPRAGQPGWSKPGPKHAGGPGITGPRSFDINHRQQRRAMQQGGY